MLWVRVREAAERLVVHPVGNDLHARGGGALHDLRGLIPAVERDHVRTGFIACAGIALEGSRPEVAQVSAGIMDGKAFVESVDDPLRLQDLDTSLVGVDAVLGDDRRPAGLDAGTCREQSGITGGDGVVDPRRRQRERYGCYQSA